jgi:hypothetical protein
MPKLVYWIAPCLTDSASYNIRTKTKKACDAQVKKLTDPTPYGPIVKHVIEYKDAFDLMDYCLSEARGCEPS